MSKTANHHFQASVIANQRNQCEAPGCRVVRYQLQRWCRLHYMPALRYGHPSVRPLPVSTWATERAAARALLAANQDHPGVVQVLRWMSAWVATANNSEGSFKGADEVARLTRHGVTPGDILAEVCAVWSWLSAHPGALPNARAEDFMISRAVFGLAPRPRRVGTWVSATAEKPAPSYSPKPKHSALSYVGEHLRVSLAPFLANVANGIATREEAAQAQRDAVRAPLQPVVVNLQ